MHKLIDTTPTLYPPPRAELLAATMQRGDPDWRYLVRHDPKGTGYSLIEVRDEDNALVGYL